MGLDIRISNQHSRSWYTAGETVRGVVCWTNKNSVNVSRLHISLEGVLETSIKPISGQESSFGTSRHILVNRNKILYPSANSPSKGCRTFGPGVHTFDFQLTFPGGNENQHLCRKCEPPLPSNFTFTADGIKASVRYTIRVVLERPGLLRQNLVKEQAVEYKPMLPFFCSPRHQEWDAMALTEVPVLYSRSNSAIDNDRSKLRRPSVTLEVTLPGPKVIRPGNPVSLSISFIVPFDLRLSFTPTWIFGLAVRLKARTVVTASHHVRAHVGYIDVYSLQAVLPVEMNPQDSKVVLPSALWEHCIYPAAIATFQFCQAERSYQLEVTVDFACSKATGAHKATTLIDIKVESGAIDASEPPPEYSSEVS